MPVEHSGVRQEGILPVLYDMSLVIGAEISLKPLLIRSLQRLLYYTSFPAGFICLDADPSVSHPGEWAETRIDAAVGDYRLVDLIGQTVRLPANLLGPGAAVGQNAAALLASLPVKPGHYTSYLRLPIDGKGVIVLLAPQLPETELPLTQMFKPVMAHLARAIVLCRSNDAYTGGLIAERDRLADQQRLAAKMFESSNSSIIITDPAGTILSVNAAFSRITGYAPDDALGQNPRLLSSGRHDRDFFRQMWHDISTKDRWIGEVWNRRQSGELFPVWLMISAVRDPAGKLTNYMGIFTDISEQKAAEAHIEYLGSHDPLTGLPNRMLLRDRTGNAIVHATREGQKLAMLYVDIDNFNTVNDSLGHGVGDDLLRMVSERLQACVRDIDTVCRLGADEFLIVLNELNDGETAAHIADKILKALAEPIPCGEHRLDASSTIGISLFPDDGDDFDTLLKHADTALRDAKLNDRGNYRFFTDAMNAGVRERFALENRLRGAVERGEFVLHYQPQIDFASRRVIGAEALIRWNSPEMGLVSPARFIPVAERSGAIVSIGAWVVFEACRQLAAWRAAGLPEMSMAVNLSAVQFKRGQLVETVREALSDYGLPAACLELELTESILIHDTEQTLEIVRSLKALGVRLSLDDFGTGYSSFSYLTRFAVDKLKIDQSFVRDMVNSQEAAKIVRAIVELGRSLGLETIAEGIETAEQSAILHDYGCDQAQGYYFSRPLPASDFPPVIDAKGLIRIA